MRELLVNSNETLSVFWISHNFAFLGGSLGCAEGEVICKGFSHAHQNRLPVVIECQSGGARMQEGTLSLMQLGKVSVCVEAHRRAGLPYISILTDPTYGGVPASYAMQSDVRIGVSGARIGFAGPAVILNTMYEMNQADYDMNCPSNFQTAEYLRDHGQLDIVICPSKEEDVKTALEKSVLDILKVLQPKSKLSINLEGVENVLTSLGGPDQYNVSIPLKNPSPLPSGRYSLSRSMIRPQCQDIIEGMFDHFVELSGDGRVGNDGCIRGGLALLGRIRTVVIASFKGHTPSTMKSANYGMATPHGYRKALKLMKLAETFNLPVITLVDTCGALPSFDAERDGQSEAIATNLTTMAGLKVPIVTIIAGEGGSGGALGIGMGNVVGMLSGAYYGVISPEGAASILGRYNSEKHKTLQFPKDCDSLATMQRIYAPQLKELGVIDQVIYESADLSDERDTYDQFDGLLNRIKSFTIMSLASLVHLTEQQIVENRYKKFRNMGIFDLLNEEEKQAVFTKAQAALTVQRPRKTKLDSTASKILLFIASQSLKSPYSKFKGKAPETIKSWVPGIEAIKYTDKRSYPVRENAKSILDSMGPEGLAKWVREQKRVLITDTTMRDAHQSLLATRVRTDDLLASIPEAAEVLHDAFSFEMWGGATFDVCYRFLHESPWERLRKLRKACPNVCFQMLLRGSNAVGYTSYPDNVVSEFTRLAAENGIDVFRIFDCFNDVEQMQLAIDTVKSVGKVAEVCLCFTGDFLSTSEKIYTLEYWRNLARRVSSAGAHMIAIKDMAGLLKPNHAAPLISVIREVCDLPIHFHTHSTSGVSLASAIAMSNAGCDIIDCAIGSMSENTSQPNLNAFIAALMGSERDTGIDYLSLEPYDTFWQRQRMLYAPFECGVVSGSARVFQHQIPGGQYANLLVQCKSMGLWSRWNDVLDMYRDVNKLLGDVVKVTPSSKVVGDLALYLLNRKMQASDVLTRGEEIEFPQSTKDLFAGRLGKPHHGLPKNLEQIVLKAEKAIEGRPGATLPAANFEKEIEVLKARFGGTQPNAEEVASSFLYPKVYEKYCDFKKTNGDVSILPTQVFWFGMVPTEEITLPLVSEELAKDLLGDSFTEWAKTVEKMSTVFPTNLSVKLVRISALQKGMRKVYFQVAGYDRLVTVLDEETSIQKKTIMADISNKCHLPSPLPGKIESVLYKEGDIVKKGQTIAIVVAMKMEVKVVAPFDLAIKSQVVFEGDIVEEGSLVATVAEKS